MTHKRFFCIVIVIEWMKHEHDEKIFRAVLGSGQEFGI